MSLNPFLDKFLASQVVIQSGVTEPDPPKKGKKGGRKKSSPYGTADGKHPFGEEDAFERLCNEKPRKKEVLKYFKHRIEELVAADME